MQFSQLNPLLKKYQDGDGENFHGNGNSESNGSYENEYSLLYHTEINM